MNDGIFATNTLNSLGSFFHRDLYAKNIYPDFLPKPIDLWGEKKLYGRIDREGSSILPSEKYMKQIVNADDKIYALNFVVDAFDDLCDYISLARQTGQITEGHLSKIKAATAFENVNQRYNEYIEIIFD